MNNTKIMYLRDASRRPFGCLAMKVDKKTNVVAYQFSVVHPKDTFDKQLAKTIATGRLDTGPLEVIFTGESTHDIVKAVMNDMLETHMEPPVPQKAKKFAKQWVDRNKSDF